MRGVISPGGLWLPNPELMKPAPRLPSYVKLDMALGLGAGATLFDKSRYRSHGTIHGASWATGAHGKCLDFDPNEPSYVEIPASHTQLDFTSEDFSIIARVKVDTLVANVSLYIRGSANIDGFRIRIITDGSLYINTYQSGETQVTTSTMNDVVVGTWATVGLSKSGASMKTYAAGIDTTATPGVHTDPATCARSAKIGIYDDKVGNPFDGKVEFLRIFGGIALSASEHLAYHNALA